MPPKTKKTPQIKDTPKVQGVSDKIVLFFVACYLIIDFLSNFGTVEFIAPQYLYLALLNLIIGIYIYYNPAIVSENFISSIKKSTIFKLYLLFLTFCLLSFFVAKNLSLSFANFMQLVVTFTIFINFLALLHNRLYLIYKVAALVSIAVFFQTYLQLLGLFTAPSLMSGLINFKGNAGNIDIFAASLNTKIPFILLAILHYTNWKKWAFILILFMASASIFLSGSRAAYIAFYLNIALFILLYFKVYSFSKQNLIKIVIITIPWVLAILTTNYIFKQTKAPGERYQTVIGRIAQLKDASANIRLENYKNALKMMKDNPILGVGIGNWRIESIPYESTQVNDSTVSVHTHSDFLEIPAETGILNGIIYLSLFICLAVVNIKTIFRKTEVIHQEVAIIALMILIAYGIDSTFNFPLYRPILQLFFGIMLALSITNNTVVNLKQSNLSKKTSSIMIGISLITVFSTYITFTAYKLEYTIRGDFNLIATPQRKLSADAILKQIPLFPNVYTSSDPFYEFVGTYFFYEKNYEQATKYLDMAAKINPHLQHYIFYKASIAIAKNRADSAYLYMKQAFNARPRDSSYYANMLLMAAKTKKFDDMLEVHTKFSKYRGSGNVWATTTTYLHSAGYDKNKLVHFVDSGLKIYPHSKELRQQRNLLETSNFVQTKEESALLSQADKLATEQQYDKALRIYLQVYQNNPSNLIISQNIGICYTNMGQYKKAISYLQNCLNNSGINTGKPEYFLGIAYTNIQDRTNGLKYLKIAKSKNMNEAEKRLKQYGYQ